MKTNLIPQKIPALRGRAAKTNIRILEVLAREGPQTTYNTNKLLGRSRGLYSTIFRAVTRLKEKKYVAKTGTVRMAKKCGRTPTYGLTWRGFIASLASDKVCSNVLGVLEKNSQLTLPYPSDVMLPMARELFSDEQIRKLARSLFEGFIKVIPNNIESLEEEKYGAYLIATLIEAPPTTLEKIDQSQSRLESVLRKYPKILDWFEKGVENFIKTLEETLDTAKKMREVLRMLRG